MRINTPSMLLRQFTWNDLPQLINLHNDPAVMRYINNGAPVDQQQVADELASWIDADDDSFLHGGRGFGFLAAVDHSSGCLLGWFHFRPSAGAAGLDAGPELGFRLRQSMWGRGLATEGARALIDRGFSELAIDRVYAHTMFIHWASRRVLEKSGMRLTRVFNANWPVRIPGDEYGDVEYVIGRTEWNADQALLIHDASAEQ